MGVVLMDKPEWDRLRERIRVLEAELAEVTKALDECDLRPHGTLADRIRTLTHHHREWKSMFADVSNKLAAARSGEGAGGGSNRVLAQNSNVEKP